MLLQICFIIGVIHPVFSGIFNEGCTGDDLIEVWEKGRGKCNLEEPCEVSLPQDTTKKCKEKREEEIEKARNWYKLTNGTEPDDGKFPIQEIPFLDQTRADVGFYYSTDKFEGRYMALLTSISKAFGDTTVQDLITKYENEDFDSSTDFYNMTKDAQGSIAAKNVPEYFSNPGQTDEVTDVLSNDKWQEDDVFVQQLLTQDCPFLVKRVTQEGDVGFKLMDLEALMSSTSSYDDAIKEILNDTTATLQTAVNNDNVYVLYNPLMDNMTNVEDFDKGNTGDSVMNEITSPITLLIKKDGILKLAAIQLDSETSSQVLTPSSNSLDWLKAKAAVQASHGTFCQGYYHAGHYHIVGSIFCVTFRRHLAPQHPLYVVLKHHCEGTIPHIAYTYPEILTQGGFTSKTYSIGIAGFEKLVKYAFADRSFGSLDLPEMMKKNGIDDKKIDYFPFRDDALVIWNEITRFLFDFVNNFYEDSDAIENDYELGNFTNEVSMNGTVGPDGGTGKFIGFPNQITTRTQLVCVLRSILWYNVLHAVSNYGNLPVFAPLQAVKFYTNTVTDTFLNLGSVTHSARVTQFRSLLGSFRANRIMNYYNEIQDENLRRIVQRSYENFQGCIQKKLNKRNKSRKEDDMLGMQILEPVWMANSIHI